MRDLGYFHLFLFALVSGETVNDYEVPSEESSFTVISNMDSKSYKTVFGMLQLASNG